MYFLGSSGDDFPVQVEFQMVDSTRFYGELDSQLIFLELHLQVLLLKDSIGDLDSHLGWGLIPAILQLGVLGVVGLLCEIGSSEFDDAIFLQGPLLGLFNFGKKLNTHQNNTYNLSSVDLR